MAKTIWYGLSACAHISEGKRQLNHLIGLAPSEDDPKFVVWDEVDPMIMS